MVRFAYCSIIAFATVATLGSPASASHNVCVPRARGVPTRNEPPKWVTWTGSPGTVDESLDDPRWQGATGQSFSAGSAKAPLQLRALWSDQGGEYLYLSFILDIEGFAGTVPATETPRDLFIGLRRSAPYDPGTPGDTSDDQYGYVFQFHLTSGSSPTLVDPGYCADDSQCSESGSAPRDYWRAYVDRNTMGSCGGMNGRRFFPFNGMGGSMDPPVTWMADKQAVRYWKQSTANRWAIQLRLPLVDAGHPLTDGVERGARLWYQATAQTTAGTYANLAWFPRELVQSVCISGASGGNLFHPELLTSDAYSAVTVPSMTPGSTPCDAGILLDNSLIGSVPDAGAADLTTVSPLNAFKAFRADGTTPVVNTVLAQPKNTSTDPITAPLSARFRLASWGSAPWSNPADTGKWIDMRGTVPTVAGQAPGICMGNSDPNADDACTPAVTIAPGQKGAISFQWQIGNDPTLGASEYCKFGLTPPGGATCTSCSCGAAGAMCDADTDTGTRSGTSPCVSALYRYDQCMLVELSAPNGNVTFVQQSAWNNMTFGQMSVMKREALIDARALPKAPGQKYQDIYLIAMPRNMPASLPSAKTGADLVRERAVERATEISAPFLADLKKLTPEELDAIAKRLEHPIPGPAEDDLATHEGAKLRRLQFARVIMDDEHYQRVGRLLELATAKGSAADLTQQAVASLGPADGASVVPTLEIYPFYQPNGTGNMYMPMTAFTVFLSHEGAMNGITWLIDGAQRVGDNIYHLRIPVDHGRRIQIRSQAIEASETPIGANQPQWPCGGCCPGKNCGLVSTLNNTLPGAVAGVFVVRRRRKSRARKPRKG